MCSTSCDDVRISQALTINIYSIVQETIVNVIKHTEVKYLTVISHLETKQFHLQVWIVD